MKRLLLLTSALGLGLGLQAQAATSTHRVQTCSTTNASTYASGAFTPAAGDLIVVLANASDTVTNPAAVTNSDGLTFYQITMATYRTTLDTIYAFVSQGFARAVSQTVTLGVTGDAATGSCIAVFSISGMSKVGKQAVLQSSRQQNQAAAGTPAPVFGASCNTNNVTAGIVGNSTNPAGMTPPTSWTEGVADGGYNTPATGEEYVFRNSGFTGTTITWGSTSASAFGDIIVEFDTSVPTCPGMALMGEGCK